MFTESQMTAEEKEMLESLLNSLFADIISDIASDRGLEIETVQKLFDDVIPPPPLGSPFINTDYFHFRVPSAPRRQ